MELNEFPHKYSLVYCFFKKPIMRLGDDGFFYESGKAKGVLVKRTDTYGNLMGGYPDPWYHLPEDYLDWKPHFILKRSNKWTSKGL